MSNTKILAIGDVHFKTTNIPEVELFIEKIIDYAKSLSDLSLIIVLGDVLDTHERVNTIPLNKAYDFIDQLRQIVPTYVLVGNHDYIQNQQYLTENHWMNGMKEWENVVIVDKVVRISINDDVFILTPYVPPGRFQDALDTCTDGWKDASCIFAHQEFFGCKMGAIVSVEGDKWPKDNPEIISGHIHSKQKPQENIYYTGSAMQHAFGESTKNIVAMLTFSQGKKYELEEIDLKLPRKKIVYLNADDMDSYEVPETEDKLKVTISGIYDQFKSFKKTKKYKKLIKKGVKVVFKPKRIEVKEQNEKVYDSDETSFSNILHTLVVNHTDPYLLQAYELVVNNKLVSSDVIFI